MLLPAICVLVILILFALLMGVCNTFPGWIRVFLTASQLERIDTRIEYAERDGGKARLGDVLLTREVDLPAKHEFVGEADAGGDGKVWVLGDDGEIVELDQIKD